jgi:hypothetical protein
MLAIMAVLNVVGRVVEGNRACVVKGLGATRLARDSRHDLSD